MVARARVSVALYVHCWLVSFQIIIHDSAAFDSLQSTLLQKDLINPLNAELNPTCHLLELLGTHHILHVSRIRVK